MICFIAVNYNIKGRLIAAGLKAVGNGPRRADSRAFYHMT